MLCNMARRETFWKAVLRSRANSTRIGSASARDWMVLDRAVGTIRSSHTILKRDTDFFGSHDRLESESAEKGHHEEGSEV